MGILDTYTLLSDDQDLSQAAGTYYSDVLNVLGDAGYTTSNDAPNGITHDLGKGTPVPFLCQVTEAFASGGAATLQVDLETDDNESFTSATVLFSSPTYALADLIVGKHLLHEFLPHGCEQYLRVKYVIGTATTTAGTVTAGITTGHQSNG